MRHLASILLVTMVLSSCGWESGFETPGTPDPSAPGAVNWEGVPAQDCASDTECAMANPPGPCEMAVCAAGSCATIAAPVGTTCEPGGLGECEIGLCRPQGEGVACLKNASPDGMPCMVSEWEPPVTIRTCMDGACGAATECLIDADCADQEDGDLCNGTVACIGRYCVLNPTTVVDCAGFAVGDCELPVCNPDTGACMATPAEDGLACDDGDDCTGDDMCGAGECLGETVLCETIGDDDLDDDGDGMTDCDDDECADLGPCLSPECGNGACKGGETCETCPEDCGACPACDDGACNGDETCETCPEDCGACATCEDGACNGDETCETCPEDCGACAACEDGACNGDETCGTCPEDCGECVTSCADHCGGYDAVTFACSCDPGCFFDLDEECCDDMCEECTGLSGFELACPSCGNNDCSSGETCETCPADCGACPVCEENGACEGDEDCASCPADCGVCMTSCDGVCGQDYTPGSDCQCNAACFIYDNCCADICDVCSEDFDAECNPPVCGDETCNGVETCNTCAGDCGTCDDPATLWITEYVEGGSNNKAVELYNGGDDAIDLASCRFNRYSNGDGLDDAALVPVAPEAETLLAGGDTWVVCHGSFTEPQLTDGTCQFTTTALNHNGNDALELICGGVPTDVFGQVGVDPGGNGWTGGDPMVSTKDMTLRRKCSVTTGDVNGTDAFDPSVEWDAFAKDTFDDLGAYVCGG